MRQDMISNSSSVPYLCRICILAYMLSFAGVVPVLGGGSLLAQDQEKKRLFLDPEEQDDADQHRVPESQKTPNASSQKSIPKETVNPVSSSPKLEREVNRTRQSSPKIASPQNTQIKRKPSIADQKQVRTIQGSTRNPPSTQTHDREAKRKPDSLASFGDVGSRVEVRSESVSTRSAPVGSSVDDSLEYNTRKARQADQSATSGSNEAAQAEPNEVPAEELLEPDEEPSENDGSPTINTRPMSQDRLRTKDKSSSRRVETRRPKRNAKAEKEQP